MLYIIYLVMYLVSVFADSAAFKDVIFMAKYCPFFKTFDVCVFPKKVFVGILNT